MTFYNSKYVFMKMKHENDPPHKKPVPMATISYQHVIRAISDRKWKCYWIVGSRVSVGTDICFMGWFDVRFMRIAFPRRMWHEWRIDKVWMYQYKWGV